MDFANSFFFICLCIVSKVIQIMYMSYQDCYNIMILPLVLFVWQPSTTGIIWRLLFPHQVKLFLEGSFDGKKDFVVKIVHTLVLITKKAGIWLFIHDYSIFGFEDFTIGSLVSESMDIKGNAQISRLF